MCSGQIVVQDAMESEVADGNMDALIVVQEAVTALGSKLDTILTRGSEVEVTVQSEKRMGVISEALSVAQGEAGTSMKVVVTMIVGISSW